MIFTELKEKHQILIKEAFMGFLAKKGLGLMARAGKVIVKNPMKSLGAGFTANSVLSGTQKLTDTASGGRNIALSAPRITM